MFHEITACPPRFLELPTALESLGCYQPIEQMTTKTWLQFNSLATTTIPCHAIWWIQGRRNYLGRLGSVPTISRQILCFCTALFSGFFLYRQQQGNTFGQWPNICFLCWKHFVPTKFAELPLPHDDCLHHLNTVFVEAAVGKLAWFLSECNH